MVVVHSEKAELDSLSGDGMKRILVTGGAGFIGSHMVESLLEHGYQVSVLDDFSTGKMENLPIDNKHLDVIEGSITDPHKVSEAIFGCDSVIHLAAIASVQASVDDPVATHNVNFDGTLILLEAAKKYGIKRFIFASSAAVYGDETLGAVSESARIAPMTPYAFDKLACEYYLSHYGRSTNIQFTAFRFFNVYGPRQNPDSPYSGVISIFTSASLAGLPLKIFGDGKQSRDFVFVKDLCRILMGALHNLSMNGKTLNIGTGRSVTLLDIVQAIETILGKPIPVQHFAPRLGDIRHSLADVGLLTSIAKELKPNSPLIEGLRETMKASTLQAGVP